MEVRSEGKITGSNTSSRLARCKPISLQPLSESKAGLALSLAALFIMNLEQAGGKTVAFRSKFPFCCSPLRGIQQELSHLLSPTLT